MANFTNLDKTQAYAEMQNKLEKIDLKQVLNKERIKDYSVNVGGGLTYNYACKPVNNEILTQLSKLAEEQEVIEKYKMLLNGQRMNTGENRLVLHQLLRGQCLDKVELDGQDIGEFYQEQKERFFAFADKVHKGEILGSTGKNFNKVVQIGIGGSDLGPRAMYLALKGWALDTGNLKLDADFISNVDPDDANMVINSLDLETTLFILVSKSGTTQETLTNMEFVIQSMKNSGIKNIDPAKHMVAVTSATSPLAKSENFLDSFYIDDFIGGRYSATSAVGGVVLSLAFSPAVFEEFLTGAHEADMLALEPEMKDNASLLDAMIGVYERLLGFPTTSILPYSQALSRFPAHLQQLDMESNGKSVNRFGEKVNYQTGPVIFGEPGTNGQHSFYQLLHQGTDVIPLQFIGFKQAQQNKDLTIFNSTSQDKLNANLAAQIIAYALGKEDENQNKNFEGNRYSSLIYGEKLDPKALGALLAHYENKVMFQGFVWNLNSFDQEGVQLGKVLADKVLAKNNLDESLETFSSILGL